ncbi:MAG: hypothetical protein F6J95_003525 [Leptolyngbya sp. SIO1E4]|nr:hypothetical protein [Leptolyngbya sp. SIO1E4]
MTADSLLLDNGSKLEPLPETEWQDSLTEAQEQTWLLIRGLAQSKPEGISEQKLYRLLGLRSSLPLRSRIKHLTQKGALKVTRWLKPKP